MVSPSGEGEIRGREEHVLSLLGVEIGEGKLVYPYGEELRLVMEKGGWRVLL